MECFHQVTIFQLLLKKMKKSKLQIHISYIINELEIWGSVKNDTINYKIEKKLTIIQEHEKEMNFSNYLNLNTLPWTNAFYYLYQDAFLWNDVSYSCPNTLLRAEYHLQNNMKRKQYKLVTVALCVVLHRVYCAPWSDYESEGLATLYSSHL